jgi:maltooligosyltrehalose trehalohydrolase
MTPGKGGYFRARVPALPGGARYLYELDGSVRRPDPASSFQPEGVHGPSAFVDHAAFPWTDAGWENLPLAQYIMYELHVGTFTPEGTFDAIVSRLDYLRALGVNAIELMPVAQFPGERNWGYDGTYPYAVQSSYGGPRGLKRLVDACHGAGIAVVLDVVYNHFGPEGNYVWEYGPYFTESYRTPWGWAINYDGPGSDGVRNYVVENVLHWAENYHIDALRIDAIHGIFDLGAKHILREIGEETARLKRTMYVVPESDLNDVRVITPRSHGGHGLDAQWNDDFHHALHTLLTGERTGYYMDFGGFGDLAKALRDGFAIDGGYSPYRDRRHGSSSKGRRADQFVVFSQNHDQVGNRAWGDRLTALLDPARLKLAAGVTLLSPFIPLLFMGEEYAERAPFQYFTSHSDPSLKEAVREGRKREFQAFGWSEVPDPQDEATFLRSKIDTGAHLAGVNAEVFAFYRQLIALRKKHPALGVPDKKATRVHDYPRERAIVVRRTRDGEDFFWAANFAPEPRRLELPFEGAYACVLDSTAKTGEAGGPSGTINGTVDMDSHGFRLYQRSTL